MIENFRDKWVEDIFHGRSTAQARKNLPYELHGKAMFKLQLINAAGVLQDLVLPPGNKLERLKGERSDEWSIRINVQWRIVFRFEPPHRFKDVGIADYH